MKPISEVPKTRQALIREVGALSKKNQRYVQKIQTNDDDLREAKEQDVPYRILQCKMKYRLLWALQKNTAEKMKSLMLECEKIPVSRKQLK